MRITIIGCGNMGTAFAKGLSSYHEIGLYDINPQKAEAVAQVVSGKAFQQIKEAVEWAEAVILAIKPQSLYEVVPFLYESMDENQILFSLLAGTSLETLRNHLPYCQVIRLMPNLAITYGQGVIGLAADSSQVDEDQKNRLLKIFEPLGYICWLEEDKMNALTALAGSGPAFILVLVEAMVDASLAMGLNANEAQVLIQKMIKGTIVMLENTGKHPGELKWQVASPGGTTIAGLKTLEEEGMRSSIIKTFLAAFFQAQEMEKQ